MAKAKKNVEVDEEEVEAAELEEELEEVVRKTPKRKARVTGLMGAAKALKARKNKPTHINVLLEKAKEYGWNPQGKTPLMTLSSALQNEIKKHGTKARFEKCDQPAHFKLTAVGMKN